MSLRPRIEPFPNADFVGSVVAVMQPAQASPRDHRTSTDGMGSTPRGLLVPPEVGTVVMVVEDVVREEPLEMSLAPRDALIEQVASAAADPALRDSILMLLDLIRSGASVILKRSGLPSSFLN